MPLVREQTRHCEQTRTQANTCIVHSHTHTHISEQLIPALEVGMICTGCLSLGLGTLRKAG